MMIENYKTVVFQKYATFTGRARRSEFWYYVLANIIISIIINVLDNTLGTNYIDSESGVLGSIYSLLVLIPGIAVGVRRIHDTGNSGWFILVPIYNFILMVTEGEKGANKYGLDPKNPEHAIEDHLVD